MVVVRGNGGFEGIAECNRFGGSIDLYLVFRLLVFLHAKGEMAMRHSAGDLDTVVAERGLLFQIEVKRGSTERIRDNTLFLSFIFRLSRRIIYRNIKFG